VDDAFRSGWAARDEGIHWQHLTDVPNDTITALKHTA